MLKTKEQKREDRQLKLIDKASEVWDNTLFNLTPWPEPDRDSGRIVLTNKQLMKLLDDRGKLRWATGVFDTFAAFTTNV